MTPRRVLTTVVISLVLAVAWSAWIAWRTERDLRAADAAVDRLQASVETGDDAARDAAVGDLREATESAASRTEGLWWAAMTKAPIYGDDAAGVEALTASLEVLSAEAIAPLVETVDSLDGLVADGRVDPAQVETLREPVSQAYDAMREASGLVDAEDSDKFVAALQVRYDDYADRVRGLAADFGAAKTAVDVLPAMLGASGPRDYLFIFQNNAEIRSTGGIAGSWARVHVDDGRIELREQGGAGDFNTGQQVAELTAEEDAVYDQLPALFFQDPNFIPDFPRAAELYNAFWQRKYPVIKLDGVLALDPVAMSYLIAGTGPIRSGALTLTGNSLVETLLSKTYLEVGDPAKQDARFQQVARSIFRAATTDIPSPVDFVQGFARAAREGRFLVAPFAGEDAARLQGTPVLGDLAGNDMETPRVDIGVNDATGSKMSYYLRYSAQVQAQSCSAGSQQLAGKMTLTQTISPSEVRLLPDLITGGGQYGIPTGSQLVTLRIYGPHGGSVEDVRLNGKPLDPEYGLSIEGRPVVTVGVLIDSLEDALLTWRMVSGPGQFGPGRVGLTPSIVPGGREVSFASAC